MRFTPFAILTVVGVAGAFVPINTNRAAFRSAPLNSVVDDKKSKKPVNKSKAPNKKATKKNIAQSKDANAGLTGIAIGVAPLVLTPLVALVVTRDALTQTASRREEIERGIAVASAAQQKKTVNTEIDGGGLAKAAGAFAAAVLALGLVVAPSFTNAPPAAVKEAPKVVISKEDKSKNKSMEKPGISLDFFKSKESKQKIKEAEELEKAKAAEAEAEQKAASEREAKAKEAAIVEAAKKKEEAAAAEKKAEAEAIEKAAIEKAANDKTSPKKAAIGDKKVAVKSTKSGLGVTKGGEIGGRVLPKEEVSSETLDFLKKYTASPKYSPK